VSQMQVFVSHSWQDKPFADAVVQGLRDAGADVWYDEQDLGAGQLLDEITRQLRARTVFIVLLSKHAFGSWWVRDECRWAYNLYRREPQRIILPVVASPIEVADFDTMLFLEDFKRVGIGTRPHAERETVEHLLRLLALTPKGEAPAASTPQPTESADDLVAHGKALVAQHQPVQALPFFERAARLAPSNFGAWFNVSYAHHTLGHWQASRDASDRALTLKPDDAATWNNMASSLINLGRAQDGLEAAERAIMFDPELGSAWSNKAFALIYLGRPQDGLEAVERALTLEPAHALAWTNKAAALITLGRFQEGLSAAERATELDPHLAMAWNNQAYALYKLSRCDEASRLCDRALALDPGNAEAWSTKGEVLTALGHFDDALLCLNRALALKPNLAEVWDDKAQALRALGRDAEAEEAERRARELVG
jgi:tetratricopeptide (TPR) repeat protein